MDKSSQHHTRHRIIRSAWTAIASIGMIGGSFMMAVGPASADSTNSYSLSQCANGGKGTLAACAGTGTKDTGYENGDLNASNSHWAEGDFVPFQLVLSNITKGSHHVILQYEDVNSGKHAYDYLGSYDATETASSQATAAHANHNDPCTGVITVCDAATPLAIQAPPDLTGANGVNALCGSTGTAPTLPATTGYFNLWGPSGSTLDSMSYESPTNQPVQQGKSVSDCHTLIDVYFTSPADGSDMVLAWGAHVASALDWGPDTGAGSINGAPYHMWIEGLDSTQGGSQQRSMHVSSLQTTISTVIEDAAGTPTTTVPLGTPIHDTATLSGASSTAGGTVTYELFNTGNCSETENASFPISSVVDVNNGVVPDSSSYSPAMPGSYSYRATYSGDAGNETSTGACEGPLQVTEAAAPIVNVIKSEPTPGDGQTVAPGQATPITYKLAVTNSGTAAAATIVVTDSIPTGTTYVANSAGPSMANPALSGTTITWTIPSLSAISGTTPAEVDLTFQVTVNSSDADGSTITNQASFSNAGTPNCDSDTCPTNTVTNKVAVAQTGANPQGPPQTAPPSTESVPPSTTTTTLKPALAFTGAHTGLLGLLGAGLIGTGGAVLVLSRRRRPNGDR